MHSCLRCSQGRPQIDRRRGRLILTEPARGPLGFPRVKAYQLLRAPAWFNRLTSVARTILGVHCPVRIAFVRSTCGAGPFYVLGLGLVIIGHDDIEQIVNRIMTTRLRPVSDVEAYIMAMMEPARLVRRNELREIVRLCVIAHELGHALALENELVFTSRLASELFADYCSGLVAGTVGVDPELCQLMFEAIGCVGAFCTHPSPARRVRAFLRGYSEGSEFKVLTA